MFACWCVWSFMRTLFHLLAAPKIWSNELTWLMPQFHEYVVTTTSMTDSSQPSQWSLQHWHDIVISRYSRYNIVMKLLVLDVVTAPMPSQCQSSLWSMQQWCIYCQPSFFDQISVQNCQSSLWSLQHCHECHPGYGYYNIAMICQPSCGHCSIVMIQLALVMVTTTLSWYCQSSSLQYCQKLSARVTTVTAPMSL